MSLRRATMNVLWEHIIYNTSIRATGVQIEVCHFRPPFLLQLGKLSSHLISTYCTLIII